MARRRRRTRSGGGGRSAKSGGGGGAVDPRRFVRQYRRRVSQWVLVAVVILSLLAWLDRRGHIVPSSDDWTRYHEKAFLVTRVVDGDTFDVAAPDGNKAVTRIRLWGIDAPEMAHHDSGKPAEYWAQEATDRVRELAEKKQVTLLLESHRLRGDFGRVLAYVVLPDGRVLNEVLIEEGHVRADPRYSHTHIDHYIALERDAKKAMRGKWAKR